MKVAVTGATGFIGRHLVRLLRAGGHHTRALSRSGTVDGADETRPFDLSSATSFDEAVDGCEGVIHAAAYLPKNYSDPDEARRCLERNALATLDLLRASQRSTVKRFVFFSSNVYLQSSTPVAETAPTYPVTHAPYYMMSKLTGEVWTEHYGRTSSLATVSLRVASVYGAGLMRGMIPTFTDNLLLGKEVTLKDGGRFRSDLVYVEDVAGAAAEAIQRDVRGVFNIGSGATASALEIATAIARLTGADPALLRVEPAGEGAPPLGFSPLDITRARDELGYRPLSVDEALERYVDWHRSAKAS